VGRCPQSEDLGTRAGGGVQRQLQRLRAGSATSPRAVLPAMPSRLCGSEKCDGLCPSRAAGDMHASGTERRIQQASDRLWGQRHQRCA